ncbi:MAG: DUF882 domain-containing protein [Pseudomonadota bacterium]
MDTRHTTDHDTLADTVADRWANGLSRRDACRQLFGLAASLSVGGVGALAGAGLLAPADVLAQGATRSAIRLPSTRGLWLYNKNTKEHVRVAHVRRGYYDLRALKQLDWALRDHHVDRYRPINRRLYDVLYVTQARFGRDRPLVVTSGYRTRQTNEKLAEYIPGVARNSLHIAGAAVDFQIPERNPKTICQFLNELSIGGVGRYSNHVHLDVGDVRQWSRV